MQIIYQDEDKGGTGRGAGIVDPVIHARRNGRCMERKHDGGTGGRRSGI